MKIAIAVLLALASTFVLALLLEGIRGVIVCGQWRDIDDWMNDEEEN